LPVNQNKICAVSLEAAEEELKDGMYTSTSGSTRRRSPGVRIELQSKNGLHSASARSPPTRTSTRRP
jgi:hypothetical protein